MTLFTEPLTEVVRMRNASQFNKVASKPRVNTASRLYERCAAHSLQCCGNMNTFRTFDYCIRR